MFLSFWPAVIGRTPKNNVESEECYKKRFLVGKTDLRCVRRSRFLYQDIETPKEAKWLPFDARS